MNLTTGILAVAMMTGAAWGQNPAAVDHTGSTAKALPQTKTNTNPVLVAQATKPAPGAPAAAVKPAAIPGAAAAPAKAAVKPDSGEHRPQRG
jgi:hypothetical protein